jgi:hypothetical protein
MPIIGAIGNASEYAYRSNLIDFPDPFDFTDLSNVEPGVTYYSEYVKITGIKSKLKVEIDPGTSYSIFASVFDNSSRSSLAFDNDNTSNANFSQDLAPSLRYTSGESYISNNQSIILSRQIPSVPTLPSASLDSSLITFDEYNPRFSQQILPSSTLPTVFGQTYTSTVSIGKSTQDWVLKVRDIDSTVNNFSFNSLSNVFAGIAVTSNEITISGLEKNYLFPSQVSTSNARIIVDNVAFPVGVSTLLQNGNLVRLDTNSSTSYSTAKSVNLDVSGFSTSWNVTTEPLDLTPTFTFYDLGLLNPSKTQFSPITNAALTALYSTAVSGNFQRFDISGLNVGLSTNITFTNGAEYQVIRPGTTAGTALESASTVKNFTDPPILVQNGDGIRIRLTSSANYSTTVTTSVTVGTVTRQVWSIQTQADPGTGTGGPITPDPPPPTIPTNTISRYYNSTITDHFYGFGSAISGTVQVNQASSTSALAYNTNAACFIGDENNGNDAFVNFGNDPTYGGNYYLIRPVIIYNVISSALVSNRNANDVTDISDLGLTDIGFTQRPNGLFYNRYIQRFRNLTNNLQSLARSWRFTYSLNGYGLESSNFFRCYQSNPGGGAQQLYLLYSHANQDHLLSLSNAEGSPSYSLVQSLGWVYPGTGAQPSGTRPLYRLYISADVNHFYTTSDVERANVIAAGAINEGRIAWVL